LYREPSSVTPQILSWAVAPNRVIHFRVQHGQDATHSLFGQLRDRLHLVAAKLTIRLEGGLVEVVQR